MINSVIFKTRQVFADPILRSWLFGRLLGRWPGEPSFTPHRPPYLEGPLPLPPETPSADYSELKDAGPSAPIDIELAGQTITLHPGEEKSLFERSFDDLESSLALHRFAWLPLLGRNADPAWVNAIWRAWSAKYSVPADGWAWHPYTATERSINILTFGKRYGLPGPIKSTLSILAAHGPAIAEKLEYFGDHHTSNHLANNGRGLFLLGLSLGLPDCTDLGGRILLEEAKRIFSPSGILREGSSHYHALLAANYRQCADAAREMGRPEAVPLTAIAREATAAAGFLNLPGGYPLIGDISPDLSPEATLSALDLESVSGPMMPPADGWYRIDCGPWSGLWHVSPDGFSHMPGHGHQDCGSFELHFKDEPVFIDPGRGAYGERGEAAFYRSAQVHNTLLVDGLDPYPPNKPYYNETFRRRIAGPPPTVGLDEASLKLRHNGFMRHKAVGAVERLWRFGENGFTLDDRIDGRGGHGVERHFVTPLSAGHVPGGVELRGEKCGLRLVAEGNIAIEPVTRWTAYGKGVEAIMIKVSASVTLPWSGRISLEIL